jgi:hypothetical protein
MPSLGMIIGLPIVGLVLVASLISFYAFGRYAKNCDEIDHGLVVAFKWASPAVAVIVVIATAFACWPFKWEYHSWQTTTGTVQTVSNRLVSTGEKSMEQRFVVAFTDGRQRACDDSRCSLLRPGMTLTLRCKRAYQWGATPGYDCNYVDAR